MSYINRMLCPSCGELLRARECKCDYENCEIYKYRVCSTCGYEMYTVEYEVDADEAFLKHWEELTNPVGRPSGSQLEDTTEKIATILKMYKMDYSVKDIARTIGCSDELVRMRLREAGVEKRNGYRF